ncbi:hypothetical protein C476_17422 [Natrinema limicola JCM 13563]|uniref:Uncharacterized protein n=1 Tax=Natrinema limicola JCM 13563 TaxID=1230457 RepID=M0BYC4_9EURY|nr:hypothetical protein C476_17422 [Natrinema limicola JCM 13563]
MSASTVKQGIITSASRVDSLVFLVVAVGSLRKLLFLKRKQSRFQTQSLQNTALLLSRSVLDFMQSRPVISLLVIQLLSMEQVQLA